MMSSSCWACGGRLGRLLGGGERFRDGLERLSLGIDAEQDLDDAAEHHDPRADCAHLSPPSTQYSARISGRTIRAAASISARWENACGKWPRCLPVGASNSSAYSPSGDATRSRRSIRSRACCSSPTIASAETSQNEQIRNVPSFPERPSSVSSVR